MGQVPPKVTVLVIGIGTVGGTLIEQILAGRERWQTRLGMELAVGSIAGPGGATAPDAELSDQTLRALVDSRRAGRPMAAVTGAAGLDLHPIESVIAALAEAGPLVVVDAAAGDQTADADAFALGRGAGIVLSNKAPMALPSDHIAGAALWEATGTGGRLRYEATCGAGLPVFSTLHAMLDTGDTVREIQGAVSGTLGAIFADLADGTTFSVAVRSAMANGFTEPDPRDDLSGLDVARKALILARTLGVSADLAGIQVEGLVPERLSSGAGVDVPGFLERMAELDDDLAGRAREAGSDGRSLRYVATVTPDGPPRVGITAVPIASALGGLRGPENAVSIRTERYDAFPLSISGPGAGAGVTAAGMLADVLALATGPLAL
jgi:homoserine dehydrogenase